MRNKFFLVTTVFIIIQMLFLEVKSEILTLNCVKIDDFDKTLSKSIYKVINLNKKIIETQIGIQYDEILHINTSEIIFKNNVYDTYSVYNLFIREITYYFPRKIVKYYCK